MTCVEDVREEVKETDRCFFNDLWRMNKDRGRGSPSKEYLERVRGDHGHDDTMKDDEDVNEILEDDDDGWGQEEEEEEEEQHPFKEDHDDVTNLLDLLNRSVTPPLPREC